MKNQSALNWLVPIIAVLTLIVAGAGLFWQAVMQLKIGVDLSPGQMVGMVGTWVIMGGIAVWLSTVFLCNLSNSTISEG